jgi:hypothetical protein
MRIPIVWFNCVLAASNEYSNLLPLTFEVTRSE